MIKKTSKHLLKWRFLLLLSFYYTVGFSGVIVSNGLTHIHDLTPGTKTKGRIDLQNSNDTKQVVKIYQRDYFFQYNGETQYSTPGDLPRSNAKWINFGAKTFILRPHEKKVVYYDIQVPETDSLNGSYWSVVMIEGTSPIKEDVSQEGFKINTLVRYAIQIVTNINKDIKSQLEFLNVVAKNDNNAHVFEVDMKNTGNYMLRPEISLEIFDTSGKSKGKFISDKKKLYPGTSARFYIEVPDLKSGNYNAVLLADCQDGNVFGANITVELKNDQ